MYTEEGAPDAVFHQEKLHFSHSEVHTSRRNALAAFEQLQAVPSFQRITSAAKKTPSAPSSALQTFPFLKRK